MQKTLHHLLRKRAVPFVATEPHQSAGASLETVKLSEEKVLPLLRTSGSVCFSIEFRFGVHFLFTCFLSFSCSNFL